MNRAGPDERNASAGPAVDRRLDLHTHSDLTDGSASPELMADAAVAAGLHTWGLSDHVRAESDWLPAYVRRVREMRRPGLDIRCGVEAKILDETGRLDLPARLPALDYVLVADHQFPSVDGPTHPRGMRQRLDSGELTASDVVDELISATCGALSRAPVPPIVAHLFSLLPKMGLSEDDVHGDHLRALTTACLAVGAAVEVNDKWRCPSSRSVQHLASAGVRIVAGSDAHQPVDVGATGFLDSMIDPHGAAAVQSRTVRAAAPVGSAAPSS